MEEDQDKKNVSLEDLLKLKRAETPTPEFWDAFDHRLQSRRLQQLVDEPADRARASWWMRFGLAFSSVTAVFLIVATAGLPPALAPIVAERPVASPPALAEVQAPAIEIAGPDVRNALLAASPSLDRGQATFILDQLAAPQAHKAYQRVLHTPAVQVETAPSTTYVRDRFYRSEPALVAARYAGGRSF